MYRGQENAVENGSSNDDATRDEEVQEAQVDDTKPIVNNVGNVSSEQFFLEAFVVEKEEGNHRLVLA